MRHAGDKVVGNYSALSPDLQSGEGRSVCKRGDDGDDIVVQLPKDESRLAGA